MANPDVKDAKLQMNAAKAQLTVQAAKIALEEYQRYQQLLPVNAVSRSQFDAVKISTNRHRQHCNRPVQIMRFLQPNKL